VQLSSSKTVHDFQGLPAMIADAASSKAMAWRAAMLRCGTAAAADSPVDASVVDLE